MAPASKDSTQTKVSWTCQFVNPCGWSSQQLRPDKEVHSHNPNVSWRLNVWFTENLTDEGLWRSGTILCLSFYNNKLKNNFFGAPYAILVQDIDNNELDMIVDQANEFDDRYGTCHGKCHYFGSIHESPLKNGTLKITVCIRWNKDINNLPNQCDPTSSTLQTFNDLSINDRKSSKNEKLNDIILVANDGKEIPAQCDLLAARSHVFAAMFAHDMKENQEKRISIDDADSTTLEVFLNFIYTGKFDPEIHSNYEVLAIAEKYDIEDLRDLSAQHIFKQVTVENAMDALVIADMYNIGSLKEKLCSYLADSLRKHLVSPDFKELTIAYKYLFGEIIPLKSEISNK